MSTPPSITNIHSTPLAEQATDRGGWWRHLDLSGEHLGVRIEELAPGDTSSVHHYHSLEEEHIIVLAGAATLWLGNDADTRSEHALREGDHVCFRAGEAVAHHLENQTTAPCRLLVFGERNPGDVVYYPENQVLLVKAPSLQAYHYTPRQPADNS